MSKDFNMDNVLEQLGHKRRTVKDLAQFLENKCDETPNYTFLLGSGCSVTSGVNTGQKLIEEWKQSIYDAEHSIDESYQHFWNINIPGMTKEIHIHHCLRKSMIYHANEEFL